MPPRAVRAAGATGCVRPFRRWRRRLAGGVVAGGDWPVAPAAMSAAFPPTAAHRDPGREPWAPGRGEGPASPAASRHRAQSHPRRRPRRGKPRRPPFVSLRGSGYWRHLPRIDYPTSGASHQRPPRLSPRTGYAHNGTHGPCVDYQGERRDHRSVISGRDPPPEAAAFGPDPRTRRRATGAAQGTILGRGAPRLATGMPRAPPAPGGTSARGMALATFVPLPHPDRLVAGPRADTRYLLYLSLDGGDWLTEHKRTRKPTAGPSWVQLRGYAARRAISGCRWLGCRWSGRRWSGRRWSERRPPRPWPRAIPARVPRRPMGCARGKGSAQREGASGRNVSRRADSQGRATSRGRPPRSDR